MFILINFQWLCLFYHRRWYRDGEDDEDEHDNNEDEDDAKDEIGRGHEQGRG